MSRGRRWVALCLLLLGAGLGGLALRAWTSADAGPLAAAPAGVGAAESGRVAGGMAAGAPSAPAASGIAPSAPPEQAAAAAGEEGALLDVCGVGRISRQEAEHWSPAEQASVDRKAQAMDRRKDAAMSQLAARLAAGSDSSQVAARILMSDWEGAAAVAARSPDAAAHRLALSGCARVGALDAAPSCRALSAQAWAQLDPEDALPWFQLMGAAVERRDDAAATQALEQALQRSRRSPSRALLRAVTPVLAVVEDREALGLAVVEVIGMEAALPDAGPWGQVRYCSAEAVKDGSRRARCERLVRWQFAHADSLLDAMVAVAIADRVGLPADQRPFTRQQLRQGQERLAAHSLRMLGTDCASLARVADWPVQWVQRGELQMALEAEAER